MSRASYHTSLKELVSHELLPKDYLKSIPKSNLSRWKKDDYNRFVGSDINKMADKHLELIQTLNHYPKMFYAYGELVNKMIQIASKAKEFRQVIKDSKEEVVEAISKVKGIIPIDKAARIFNITKGTFHAWVIDTKLKCEGSFFKQCLRAYPNQILSSEVKNAIKALYNPKTRHWSIRSIYYKGIRKGQLSISLNTLYRLNRKFGIRKSISKLAKKKKQKKGIRASKPNTIWHTDITFMKTLDGKKYAIYLLIDNFSRKVLSYDVQPRVMGRITSSLINQAYESAKAVSANLNIDLIVDGGPENNNIFVQNFIENSEVNIRKHVALRDVPFSNSMIERVNHTLKYRYLFPKQPRDLKHLKRTVRYFINDYNNIKPHGQLEGLTPHEAWIGVKADKSIRTTILKQARSMRIEVNKANRCEKC